MRTRFRIAPVLTAVAVLAALMFGAGGTGSLVGRSPVALAAGTSVVVHYHRFADDYDTWNLWMWPHLPAAGDGKAYQFDGADAFGKVAHPVVPGANTEVGIIVRQGEWKAKDVNDDRFIPTPNGTAEVWLVQGDPTIYTSLDAATKAVTDAARPRITTAYLDAASTIVAHVNHPVTIGSATDFVVTDSTTGQTIAVRAVTDGAGASNVKTDGVTLQLSATPDVTHTITVSYAGGAPLHVMPRLVLDATQYYYAGNDMGAIWKAKATTFRVWVPLASDVHLFVYRNQNGSAGDVYRNLPMQRSTGGTWYLKVKGNLKGMFYIYQVTNFGNVTRAVDPYAQAVAVNGAYGQIVNLAATNPKGWKSDHYRKTAHQEDAVIYETHVRDFSINVNSGMKHRGKFLAFTERGTRGPGGVATGVDHLKSLGISHVELLPAFGCNTLDEIRGGSTAQAPAGDGSTYNWCYDPRNYNVPNGAYATDPHGFKRITEFKQMVAALHKQGLGLIMDVVYNHTNTTSTFDNLVPGYYYRRDNSGALSNGSGTGNDVAAERPMIRKFIVDSLKYWVKQYHVDGFRFDLMSLLGKTTVQAGVQAIRTINPSAVVLGEPWDIQTGILGDKTLIKGEQQGTHIAVFNDDFRNALGLTPFDTVTKGYEDGDPAQAAGVKIGVAGTINYAPGLSGFALNPDESVNYITSHDGLTLWDRIHASNPGVSDATAMKMDELGQAVIMTSQGVAFLQGGEEFLRSKGGDKNSYISGDAVNAFDWTRAGQYADVVAYYAGLIHLRNAHPAFRMTSAADIKAHLTFLDAPANVVAFHLSGNANGDSWKDIVVMYNPNGTDQQVALPSGAWTVAGSGGKIGTNLGTATGQVSVPAYGAEILYR